MFRRFKKILFGSRSSDLPVERDDQSAWIKNSMREWQLRWHDLFDADRDLIAAGEFDRPDPIPHEIDSDFRLIFGLSRASQNTRKACFELFPSGTKMHERFHKFLSSKPLALKEDEARARLTEVIALIEAIGPNEDVDLSNVMVVDRDTAEGLDILSNTDDVTVLLEGSTLAADPAEDIEKVAAKLFLTEPLYAAAGNYYQVSDWVSAAMTAGAKDKLHCELCELWAGGWQVALSSDGLIFAARRV